jgi:Replication-relaxation
LRGPQRGKDEALIADASIAHQLRINGIYCALKYLPIPVRAVTFKYWRSFQEPLTPTIRLIPDGYVELGTPSGPVAAFLEVDLGSESLAVWKEKIRNYLQLALSGECERLFGQSRFRVLVVAYSERRVRSIRTAIAAETDKIFWLTSFESIGRDGLFGSIWLRPKDDTPQTLIKPESNP